MLVESVVKQFSVMFELDYRWSVYRPAAAGAVREIESNVAAPHTLFVIVTCLT